jgi:protein-disulfide isomerase
MDNHKKSPIQFLVIVTSVILVVLIALVFLGNKNTETTNDITFETTPPIEGQPVLGNPDAPVTVVGFSDYKCPACKAWEQEYLPSLVEDYIKTGKVKFAHINVLFHGEESILGSLAGEAIYSQNPNAFWQFHQALFNVQPNEDHDTAWITTETVLDIASGIPEIDIELLKTDIENKVKMDEVEKDNKLVEEFQVELTPSIMINDTMVEDPFDYERIKSLIESELKGN